MICGLERSGILVGYWKGVDLERRDCERFRRLVLESPADESTVNVAHEQLIVGGEVEEGGQVRIGCVLVALQKNIALQGGERL